MKQRPLTITHVVFMVVLMHTYLEYDANATDDTDLIMSESYCCWLYDENALNVNPDANTPDDNSCVSMQFFVKMV